MNSNHYQLFTILIGFRTASPKKGEKAWVITRKEFPKKVTVPQSKPRKV